MKRSSVLVLLTLFISTAAYGQSPKGTHSNEGPIVDILKESIASYNSGDWNTYRSNFADTARFHINSPDPISLDERMSQLVEGLQGVESYEIVNPVYAHIHTAEGLDWGMVWGAWVGTVAGEEETIMLHTATRFENGKAVIQWGFWDSSEN